MEEKVLNEKVFVRVFIAKSSGKKCRALVVKYGKDKEKILFIDGSKLMDLLDMKPSEFYDLAVGEYSIA